MSLDRMASQRFVSRIFGAAPGSRLALLRAFWPQAVGAELARRTEVVALEGRVLRIRVPDMRWRKVLHRMQRDILKHLYAAVGALAPSQLSFVEEPVADPAPEPKAPASPAPKPPSAVLREGAAVIEDAELRERFLSTAARYLARTAQS